MTNKMKYYLLPIICLIYVLGDLYAQDSYKKIYTNDSLGISFYFDKDIDDPYGFYYDTIPIVNVNEWKTYSSQKTGIKLKHPKSLIVHEEKETVNGKLIDVIKLGSYIKKDKKIFQGIIEIYTEDNDFYQIAKSNGFNFTPSKDSAFMDGCGDRSFAANLKGYSCNGLRITYCAIFSDPELGANSIPNEVTESLLVFKYDEVNKLVASFNNYLDKTALTENEF